MDLVEEFTFTATLKAPLPIGAGALASGSGTEFGDCDFFTNPRIETGDARYAWLNTTFFIGEGRILPGLGVAYRVWRPA